MRNGALCLIDGERLRTRTQTMFAVALEAACIFAPETAERLARELPGTVRFSGTFLLELAECSNIVGQLTAVCHEPGTMA
jgi:hypothetical protein